MKSMLLSVLLVLSVMSMPVAAQSPSDGSAGETIALFVGPGAGGGTFGPLDIGVFTVNHNVSNTPFFMVIGTSLANAPFGCCYSMFPSPDYFQFLVFDANGEHKQKVTFPAGYGVITLYWQAWMDVSVEPPAHLWQWSNGQVSSVDTH